MTEQVWVYTPRSSGTRIFRSRAGALKEFLADNDVDTLEELREAYNGRGLEEWEDGGIYLDDGGTFSPANVED